MHVYLAINAIWCMCSLLSLWVCVSGKKYEHLSSKKTALICFFLLSDLMRAILWFLYERDENDASYTTTASVLFLLGCAILSKKYTKYILLVSTVVWVKNINVSVVCATTGGIGLDVGFAIVSALLGVVIMLKPPSTKKVIRSNEGEDAVAYNVHGVDLYERIRTATTSTSVITG